MKWLVHIMNSKKLNDSRFITRAICVIMLLVTVVFVSYQYFYYQRFSVVHLHEYNEIAVDWQIDDIHWKDPDYDYITGRLSIDGSEMTTFPTRIVFYNDEDDVAFALPVKLTKDVPAERERENIENKDLRDFINHDVEYIYNAGEDAEDSRFYCLITRDNVLRNYFKIAYLINTDDGPGLVKTDRMYKYPETQE